MKQVKQVSIKDAIGGGYDDFWSSKQRYVVCKGSRASKKSTTAALKLIAKMMQYPQANTLVVRQVAATLKDSCFAQLQWAIQRLGVGAWWKARVSPLELEYTPTGQKILFRGCDDGMKITSITVKTGVLCWAWLEEAYEVSEDAFNRIDESLRGILPEGYYIQWLITFNPWSSSSWLKSRFFDTKSDSILALTTNYKCNEWLGPADLEMFENMRKTDPQRYKVAGLGEWGIEGGQFFAQFDEAAHIVEPFEIPQSWIKFRAMDWGSYHPYACLWCAIDYDGNMYVYRELYGWGGKPDLGTGETAREVGEKICDMEDIGESISYAVLDNACWAKTGVTGPSIAEELNNTLWQKKLQTFSKCSKGRLEASNAIKQRLIGNTDADGEQKPALYIFSSCIHLIRTLPQLAHDKKNPETYDTNGEDHAVDALAYACLSRPWSPIVLNTKRKPRERYHKEEVETSAWVY